MKNSRLITVFTITALIGMTALGSCSKDNDPPAIVPPSYTGTISDGGISYDKFWSDESPYDQTNAHLNTLKDHGDFFRCKQCHGWDGLGSNGAYINRGPKSTRPNVSGFALYEHAQTKTAQELFDGMKKTAGRRAISYDLSTYDPETNNTEGDKMPDLNGLMTDEQIWDLVKFMKEGMFDVSKLYDATYEGVYPTGSKSFFNVGLDGDPVAGLTSYTDKCSVCHGADGTTIDLEGRTIGRFTREKSNEMQHKVKYGQLGSPMLGEFDITLAEMKDLYKACADTVAFPN
jgi:hypothetical protein